MNEKWISRFMQRAFDIATWSKDPDRKVGAVITSASKRVLAEGYNGFPSGLNMDEATVEDKELKLAYTVHAEMNCIVGLLSSFKINNGERDRHLFLTMPPCVECAKFIASTTGLTGIKYVHVFNNDLSKSKWNDSIKLGKSLLVEMDYEVNTIEAEAVK